MPCHGHQIDAVSVSIVGQIVAQMSSMNAHRFCILETSNIIPINFGVSKGWPTVRLALLDKLIHGATARCCEQWQPCIGIVKGDGSVLLLGGCYSLNKGSWFGVKVSRMLRVVAVLVANSVGCFHIAPEAQFGLDGSCVSAVSFLPHNGVGPDQGVLFLLRIASDNISDRTCVAVHFLGGE